MRYTLIKATISDRDSKWVEQYISKNILTLKEATMKLIIMVDNFNAGQKRNQPLRSLESIEVQYLNEIL